MDDDDSIQLDLDVPATRTPTTQQQQQRQQHQHQQQEQQQQPPRPQSQQQQQHHQHPEDLLTPLEQEVLDEYAKLASNLDDLSTILSDLASKPSAEILDALRGLERKTTTVFTLLKASVYSIVLQQGIGGEGEE